MKRLFITSLIALGMLCSSHALAATPLSDTELAGVSGGVDMPLDGQSLPQEQQQPGSNSSGYTPLRQPQSIDGMELTPELFAVLQSRIDAKRERKLLLHGTTQQNAIALNLENVLSSDIVSTNNVFNGGSLSLDDVTTGIEINQLNDLNQLHRTQGSLHSSIAGHRYETTTYIKTETEQYDRQTYYRIDQHATTSAFSHNKSKWNAEVSKIASPEELFGNFEPIVLLGSEPFFIIDPIAIDLTWEGLFGDENGVEASYSGLSFEGPKVSFNGMKRQGDDLLVDATARLADIDFGILEAKVCAVDVCVRKSKDLGHLEILSLFELLEKEDPKITPSDSINFSKDGIIFEGMGSLFEDELNLNTGFALAGKGHIKLTEPASINVGGEFTFGAEANLKFLVDFGDLDLFNLGPRGYPTNQAWETSPKKIWQLVDATVPFTLLDVTGDAFELEFEGVLIAQLGPGDVTAEDGMNYFSLETLEEDNTLILTTNMIDINESTFSESYEHSVFTGGRMTGGEAELLALSEGTLSVDNSSTISLTDGAQQNMRVLHGVNATSSIAANALNIGRPPSFTAGPSATPRTSIQQQNRFNQQL
jgi:hypothetical protein